MRAQGLHVLELEARELADDRRTRLELAVECAERTAHVAADGCGPAVRSHDRADQLGRRRLPVRARDAHVGLTDQAGSELDLAPHREAPMPRGGDEGGLARDPGAFHEELHVFQERAVVVRAQSNFDACAAKPSGVEARVSVDADDPHAAAGERERGRLPGARQAQDEGDVRKARGDARHAANFEK